MTYQDTLAAAQSLATPLPTETVALTLAEARSFQVAIGSRVTDVVTAIGSSWTTAEFARDCFGEDTGDFVDLVTITPEGIVSVTDYDSRSTLRFKIGGADPNFLERL